MALYPQTRASQKRKDTETRIDEEFAMEIAGLSGTYKSNPRRARKILKEKLNKMQEANSISGWSILKPTAKNEKCYVLLNYRKSRKKTKEIDTKI